jgi:hypothetical protein
MVIVYDVVGVKLDHDGDVSFMGLLNQMGTARGVNNPLLNYATDGTVV